MAIFCGDVDASWLSVYMAGSLVRLPMTRTESGETTLISLA